jgi:hypothetical protein
MAAGVSATGFANKVLDGITRTGSFPSSGTLFVKLHTGDPGSAGTSNSSANTTRGALTFGSVASGGVATATAFPSWTSWASGSETLRFVSLWDASSGGTFLWSIQLGAEKAITNGDTFTLSALTLTVSPTAA